MATKNLVPRTGSQGGIGTDTKPWKEAIFSTGSFQLISGSLTPDAKESWDLGTAVRPWREIYVSTSSINFVNPTTDTVIQSFSATSDGFSFGSKGDAIISGSTISGSKLHITGNAFIGGNLTIGDADTDSVSISADLTSNLIPNADATYDLGSTSKGWNDIHLGSGGVINLDGGDVTLTHAAGKVTWGGDGAVEIDFNNHEMTNVDINSGTINGITDLAVADGGTGASTFTDGGILLGSGTDPITVTAVLGDGEILIGDGSGDPTTLDVGASGGITTLGTISTGVWEGTTVAVDQGGTGATSLSNLITLSTHTTGNYVATLTGGTGITSTGATSGEGIAHSISVDASQTQITGVGTVTTGTWNSSLGANTNLAISGSIDAATGSMVGNTNITTLGTIGTGTWEATDVAVAHGGTGVSTLTDGGVLLGSGTGAITAMAVLGDSEIIVGDGSGDPVAESGATLRTSIGVGTGDSPQFTAIELGHASNTTIARSGAGDITIEGNHIYRAGGTDVAVADGGTGASSLTDGGVLLGSGTSAVTAMAVLADGEFIVGDGSTDPVAESGATLRTSIGVGTGDSPQFTAVNIGAASDTTLAREGAGDLTVEGNHIYRVGGTDVSVADGGTGASSLTQNGVLIGNGTSAVTAVDLSTDGVIVIGDGSGNPTTLDVGGSGGITILGTIATGTWEGTTIAVDQGGTGATSLSNLITLGTHTTGNYVATVADSGGGGITVANSGAESAAVTLELDINGLTTDTIASGDFIAFSDEGEGGDPANKDTIDDVASLFAGTGLSAASAVISIDAADTTTTSIINSSLGKIGTAADQEYITFGTSNEVNTFINNTERHSVTAAGVDITGALTISGNLTVNGTTSYISSSVLDIGDRIVTLNANNAAGDGGLYVIDTDATETGSLLWDVSADRWIGGLKDSEVNLVTISSTDTLTNKTLTTPTIGNFSNATHTHADSANGGQITLGTGTTGNYVSTAVAGTGISVSGATGNVTISSAITAGDGLTLNTADIDIDAAQTTITSILATDLKIGEDDQTKIDFETADTINFYAGNEKQLILTDGALTPGSNAIVDLGTDSLEFKDAYFDGTLEADAITIAGTALNTVIAGVTVTNATTAAVATTVTISDNESTNEENAILFSAGADADGGNLGVEQDHSGLTYNPSTGTVTATGFSGNLTGTLQTAAQGNITSLGTLTTLTVDDITINGSTISDGGDLTIDAEGDITIDANGADIILKDDGTAFGRFKRDTSDFVIKSETNDKDILFKGVDNTSTITALTLDMSEAGAATFGGGIADAGTIGAGTWQGTDVAVSHGGTGASTFTDGGVLLGSGTSAITATAVLGNGELLIGDNSTDPTVATLTGTANQITVTNGGGSITLSTPQSIDTGADVTFGTVRVDDATAASSKTTGALIVDGGVGVALDVHAGGDVVAYASSDVKLKDNIEVIEDSLDKISEIRGVKFDWNEESPDWAQERGHDVGVIAQEVQKVLPEIVTERTNGYLGVDYKRIIPLLIESIKELKQEVEDLKKKVN